MVFFCFAVTERIPLINDFYHYLRNFGVTIWYDRRNIFHGDDRVVANLSLGAGHPSVRYAVIFYSKQFENGNICLEEYRILEKRHTEGDLHLFPIFLNSYSDNIADNLSLCKKLVYKIMTGPEDFYHISLHILSKITFDLLQNSPVSSTQGALSYLYNKHPLLYKLFSDYEDIKKENYQMRVVALYNIYTIAAFGSEKEYLCFKTMNYIYHRACLINLVEERRELQIMENIVFYTVGSSL